MAGFQPRSRGSQSCSLSSMEMFYRGKWPRLGRNCFDSPPHEGTLLVAGTAQPERPCFFTIAIREILHEAAYGCRKSGAQVRGRTFDPQHRQRLICDEGKCPSNHKQPILRRRANQSRSRRRGLFIPFFFPFILLSVGNCGVCPQGVPEGSHLLTRRATTMT